MKYFGLSFLAILALNLKLFGSFSISGVIDNSTTWTKANSPYTVVDNVLITEGTSLTIEAGVVVKFAPSTYLKVEGQLKGIGSETEQVIFESESSGSSWAGIKIRSTGGTNLDQSLNYQSGSILKNVTIRDASLGLYVHATGFLVEQCKFYNNQTAMEIRSTTGVVVRDSNFTDNSSCITSVYSDYAGDNVSRINNTQIVGNIFNGNDTGIGLIMNQRDFKDLNISKNIFRDGGTAIRFGGGGYGPKVHSVYINDNVVLNHSIGINVANVYGGANQDTNTMPEYPIDCQRNILLGNTTSLSVSANGMKNRFSNNIFIGSNGISISSSGGNDLYTQNVVIADSKGIYLSGSSSYHPNSISVDRNLLIQKEQSSSPFVDFLWGSNHKLTNNNILGLGEVLKIGTANDANATGNYWGKTTLESIRELTNDYYDDFEKGKALVEPFEASLRTDVPIMPPSNVEKIGVTGGVKITWSANAESDVTGYRVHYGSPSGYGYANVVNVGSQQTHTITGASLDDEISVTAYDAGASNLSDVNSVTGNQLNLSESWFSKAVRQTNSQPVITSTSAYTVAENELSVGSITATDEDGDTLTFSITGGLDSGKFDIDPNSGALAFATASDYEEPTDANLDNIYEVAVSATDGLLNDTQVISITVTDGYDPSRPNHFVESAANLEMIWVEPGTFTKGSPTSEAHRDNSTGLETSHEVTLTKGFYLGKYEVTQAQYEAVMSGNTEGLSSKPSNWPNNANRPVERTSWEDVQVFLKRLNVQEAENITDGWAYVLPTDAEWEYACRAGTNTAYSWGNTISQDYANYSESGYSQTRDIAQYFSNPWGFFDMHGNVWEWTADWYTGYTSAPQTDPTGPGTGTHRVFRGGSWAHPGALLRSAFRGVTIPSDRSFHIGFRLGFKEIPIIQNEPPVITSASSFSVSENETVFGTITATDQNGDSLTYSLSGGSDQAMFTIDANSGALAFASAPDYENPSDTNNDNIYEVIVSVSDGSLYATQTIFITVTDLYETSRPNHFVDSAADMEMIWVEPGTFMMGSPETEAGRNTNETQHEVTLTKGFYLGKYEVTQSQYEAVMTGNTDGLNPLPSKWGNNPNQPVEKVSWDDIQVFLTLLNAQEAGNIPEGWAYVLPTEAQWEYACRAGTTTRFAWGDTINLTQANYQNPDIWMPTPVGNYQPNAWGFFDMHANVHEWVADWYTAFNSTPLVDPLGPSTGNTKVIKDGSWYVSVNHARSAHRSGLGSPNYRDGSIGFRLAFRQTNLSVPVITSPSAYTVAENQQIVANITATDEDGDTLTFSITGGSDASKFAIDPSSGALTFSTAPDFEEPTDANRDNVYEITVSASDAHFSTSKTVQVTITNVVEAPTNILLSATEIEENQPAGTVVGDLALVDPESADNLDEDEYRIVVLNTSTNQLSEVNQDTGALTPLMTVSFNVGQAHGFDRNPADGKLYLSRIPADNTLEFYEIDLDAQSATLVKSFSTNFSRYNFSSMGFTNEGDVYLYQEVSAFSVGSLHFVDWDAGTVTRKGSTNTPSILGGDYDAQRNVFWATDEWNGKLYQVNLDTSAITWTSTSTWNYGNGPNIGDVDVTPDGQVLVAVDDYGSSKILKVDPDAKNWTVLYTLSEDAEMRIASVAKKATGRLELVAGAADNQHFQISGDQLLTNQEFDFEEKNEYSVTIRGWNEHNLSIDRTFALSITDIYEKPNPNIFVESAADMEMIWVEPGTYAMGPTAWDGNRQVTISNGFYLGKYEVTQAQYEAVMTGNTNGLSPTPSNWPNYPDRPVEKVSWNDARIFFDRLTKLEQAAGRMEPDWEYVLPTDAEWEYACRAGTTTEYSWGNEISTAKANYNSSQTVNVGSYEANPWGFHDMHGNLYEWVWDWKSDAGSYGNFTDPQGAEKGLYKIKRGGSWLADASQLKSSAQSLQEAPQRGSFLGLRAALKYFPNRTPKELTSVAPLEVLPNKPTGTQVGEFTAIDLDADPLTYQLVSGSGDTHNSQFTLLANGTLSTAQSLAFDNGLEAYSIRVRASDEDGEYVEAVFSITEIEVYEPEYPNHVVKSAADMEMIFVSPGTFAMGPTSWDGKRQVTITKGYFLGKHEVTQAQYQAVMTGNPNGLSPTPSNWPNNPNWPVEKVSWNDAQRFFERLNSLEQDAGRLPDGAYYTLPTDAEWEYACRAGTTSEYSWGDDVTTSMAKYNSSQPTNVGSYPANPWGFHDMHGNVYEWVWDWRDSSGSWGNFTDPEGPATGTYKIKRGGSWLDNSNPLKSSYQSLQDIGTRGSFLGLRVALKFDRYPPPDMDAGSPPVFTSAESLTIPENLQNAGTIIATDSNGNTLSYSITGGADASKFTISATTGVLTFLEAPDYENPSDNNADNVFEITVSVSDGKSDIAQNITVTITDLYEPSRPNHIVESAANLEMIWVEPGTFTMGQNDIPNASPEHEVTLTQGFYLGKFEVTQAQYEAVMTGNSDGLSATPSNWRNNPNRPVEKVSWDDIQVFLTLLNTQEAGNIPAGWAYVLPTEAQWEYACRAGTTTAYSWGNTITSTNANYSESGLNQTTDVGQYSANPWGFFDMHGNVWEWTADAYRTYASGAQTDPFKEGVASSFRVFRGGSWFNTGANLRSANRDDNGHSDRFYVIGFRVGFQQIESTQKSPPTITSASSFSVSENETTIATITATDEDGDPLNFKIKGGPDSAQFSIDHASGALTFTQAPDYENPTDDNTDNVYQVTVSVTPNHFVESAANMEMIWVEPGTFTMGSPESEVGRNNDETQHEVTLTKGFYLGKYEVTQSEYEAVMLGNGDGLSATPSRYVGLNRPVENVSWDDIQVFLTRLNAQEVGNIPAGWAYVLPTEAQWEYACRAGTTTAYSWGNEFLWDKANHGEGYVEPSENVGQYGANPWGFYDMHGNVHEWTADWSAAYSSNAKTDPVGPGAGSERVYRGGSWTDWRPYLRSAFRTDDPPQASNQYVGFRLALKNSFNFNEQSSEQTISVTVKDVVENPTSLSLNITSILENLPVNTLVGKFSASGGNPTSDGQYSYSLVTGNGDADNESFSISNNQLLAKKSFDYETKNSYSIRVRVNDASSGSMDKSFTISIGDAEENAPPVIDNLTGKNIIYQPGDYWGDAYVSENQTEVATISANDPDGDTISFSLITDGYPDSQWLSIDSTSGKVTFKQAPDFEDPQDAGSDNSYQIKVKASDGTLEDTLFLTVFVQNVIEKPIDNEAPLPLALTFLSREVWVGGDQDFSIRELQPSLRVQDDVSGFASGSIRWSVDGGAYASVTFSGANPSSGNANLGTFLAIQGSSISRYSNEQEAVITYIYLIDNDGNSKYYDRTKLAELGFNLEELSLSLKIKNSPPTGISLDKLNIAENLPAGTLVANLSASDPDEQDRHTFSLVGDYPHHDLLEINGTTLRTTQPLDYETHQSLSIQIEASDQKQETFRQQFTISVTDDPTDTIRTLHVDQSAQPSGDGTEENPYQKIQDAIDAANSDDIVIVHPGTYAPFGRSGYIEKNLTIGSLFLTTGKQSYIEQTIVDGGARRDESLLFNEGKSSSRIHISGLTFINGENVVYKGSAIKCEGKFDLTLDHVIMTDHIGSAVDFSSDGNLLIKNSQFRRNWGGVSAWGGNISIVNSLIVENSQYAISAGNNSGLLVSFSTISQNGNQPVNQVPGLDLRGTSHKFENSIVANNPTGFKLGSGSLIIENSLVVGGRSAIEGDGQITWGAGNLEDDPKFTSPLAGDFSLSEYSPAIGQASSTHAPSIDLYGLPRPSPANSNPDMGAIEHERAAPKIFINSAPRITSNGGGNTAVIILSEAQKSVTKMEATDPDGDNLQFLVSGGDDQAQFVVNQDTQLLQFASLPDFENPADSNGDNLYSVEISVTDGDLTDTQYLTILVTDMVENTAPFFTSNEGKDMAVVSMKENISYVTTLSATDQERDILEYGIEGGSDARRFYFDTISRELSFQTEPDFENPIDENGDNIYEVILFVSDGDLMDRQTLYIQILDMDENLAPIIISYAGAESAELITPENETSVTKIQAVDPDGSPINYFIEGGVDANLFLINSTTGAISFSSAPDYEAPTDQGQDNIYEVSVGASDGKASDTIALSIEVVDIEETKPIANIKLSSSAVSENLPAGSEVGSLSAVLSDGSIETTGLTYEIVPGVGDDDNENFQISNNLLKTTKSLDYETQPIHSIRLRAELNNGDFLEKILNIFVIDVLENTPPSITHGAGKERVTLQIRENQVFVAIISTIDSDGDDLFFDLKGGLDQSKFKISQTTGNLSFVKAPDYESPTDSNSDNTYEVVVVVSDGEHWDEQAIEVVIFDDSGEDSDGDGLSDLTERQIGTDPADPDTDDDKFKDGEEIDEATDPLDPEDYPGVLRGFDFSTLELVEENDDIQGLGLQSLVNFPAYPAEEFYFVIDGRKDARGVAILNYEFAENQSSAISAASVSSDLGVFDLEALSYISPEFTKRINWRAPASGIAELNSWAMQMGDSLEVYRVSESGQLEFVLGKLGDSESQGEISQFSFYVKMDENFIIDIATTSSDASDSLSLTVIENETGRPHNDDFEAAHLWSPNASSISGSNQNATSQLGEPVVTSANPPQRSVWWKWTAPANGILSLATSSAEMDTVLALFAGWALDDLILCAENNNQNSSTNNSAIAFEVSQGIEYSIMVSGNAGSQGSFELTLDFDALSQERKPSNDDFSSARKMSGYSASSVGHNRLASEEENEGMLSYNQSNPIHSVWWYWQAPATGTALVSLAGSEFDTLLKVFEGSSLNNLILVGENDDHEGVSTSELEFFAEAGKTYYFSVDGFEASTGGIDIAVHLNEAESTGPANDSFANALLLQGFAVRDSGTNIGATGKEGEFSTPLESATLPSVWWKWIPNRDGYVSVDTTGSNFDTILEVFRMDAGQLVSLGQNDDFFGSSSLIHFYAFAQSEYYILVAGRSEDEGLILLNIKEFEQSGGTITDDSVRTAFLAEADSGEWENLLVVTEQPEKATESSKFYTIENVPQNKETNLWKWSIHPWINLLGAETIEDISIRSEGTLPPVQGLVRHSGEKAFYLNGNENGDSWLLIEKWIYATKNSSISWWEYLDNSSDLYDAKLQYSLDGEIYWEDLHTSESSDNFDFQNSKVSLASLDGKRFKLRFVISPREGFDPVGSNTDWFLDEIEFDYSYYLESPEILPYSVYNPSFEISFTNAFAFVLLAEVEGVPPHAKFSKPTLANAGKVSIYAFLDDSGTETFSWRYSSWYGNYFFKDKSGWFFTIQRGWQFFGGSTLGGGWIYDHEFGWMWTGKNIYPWAFHTRAGKWIYDHSLQTGTRSFSP